MRKIIDQFSLPIEQHSVSLRSSSALYPSVSRRSVMVENSHELVFGDTVKKSVFGKAFNNTKKTMNNKSKSRLSLLFTMCLLCLLFVPTIRYLISTITRCCWTKHKWNTCRKARLKFRSKNWQAGRELLILLQMERRKKVIRKLAP